MLDMTAIAQSSRPAWWRSTPPSSWAIGSPAGWERWWRRGHGAAAAFIIAVISVGYEAFRDNVYVSRALRGMQAGVAAVVFSVVLHGVGALKDKKWASLALMAAALIASRVAETERHLDTAVLRAVGVLSTLWTRARGGKKA